MRIKQIRKSCIWIMLIIFLISIGNYFLIDFVLELIIIDENTLITIENNEWLESNWKKEYIISKYSTKSRLKNNCYFLFKTHKTNEDILQRILKANNEIQNYNCTFFVVYLDNFGNKNFINDISKLNTIGFNLNKANLMIINDYTIKKYMFHLFDEKYYGNIKWLTKANFYWEMGDLFEILWYKEMQNITNNYIFNNKTLIWTIENDVGWKGNLGEILIKTFNIPEYAKYNYLQVDKSIEINGVLFGKWMHHSKILPYLNPNSNYYLHSSIPINRYKIDLLEAMFEQINNNIYVYCEARANNICVKTLKIDEKPDKYMKGQCNIGIMIELHPELFYYYPNYFNPSCIIIHQEFQNIIHNNLFPNNTLYHRVRQKK